MKISKNCIKLSILLATYILTLGSSQNAEAQGNNPPTENEQTLNTTQPAKPKGAPLQFETKAQLKNITPNEIVSGAFYYSNANDDPSAIPVIAEENGIKYIEVRSVGTDPAKIKTTETSIDRWVKIPAERPSAIRVKFKTKVTKSPEFDWATSFSTRKIARRLALNVDFLREDGLKGGGIEVSGAQLSKSIDEWKDHEYTISIPKDAKFLHLNVTVSGGFTMNLGNWTID